MFYLFNSFNDLSWENISYTNKEYSFKINTNDSYIKELGLYTTFGCIVGMQVNCDDDGIYHIYDNPMALDYDINFIFQYGSEYYLWRYEPKDFIPDSINLDISSLIVTVTSLVIVQEPLVAVTRTVCVPTLVEILL